MVGHMHTDGDGVDATELSGIADWDFSLVRSNSSQDLPVRSMYCA